MIQLPQRLDSYNLKTAQELREQLLEVRTFADVAAWDTRASAEFENLNRAVQQYENQVADFERFLKSEEENHKGKPILGRLFGGRSERKKALEIISGIKREIESTSTLADKLDASIATSPNDKSEQKELLKELRLRKKELMVEKKEAAAAMREVRAQARQSSAGLAGSSGSLARMARVSVRLNKESKLRPHENQKEAIERQIITIDRMINWVERFKE